METCEICNKEYKTDKGLIEHQRKKHPSEAIRLGNDRLSKKYGRDTLVECKVCGVLANSLSTHIIRIHSMSTDEYKSKYNCVHEDIYSERYLDGLRERIKDNNPGTGHGGKFSPYSKNFVKYQGLSDEEVQLRISKLYKKTHKSIKDNPQNQPTKIEFYLKQGLSEEEAREKLSERQSTFSLEKCIEKYGEEEGLKRFTERQDKWQNTLKSKPEEEIREMNRKKLAHCHTGYSKISQELFIEIYKEIKDRYNEIYFATLSEEGIIQECTKKDNREYIVDTEKSFRRLDFYIHDTEKCIEFDGDYWHGQIGNVERDRKRDEEIKEARPNIQILRIPEQDFKKHRIKTIEKCINFLND
jgi:hypothetical protein